jgi:hypothetical protein
MAGCETSDKGGWWVTEAWCGWDWDVGVDPWLGHWLTMSSLTLCSDTCAPCCSSRRAMKAPAWDEARESSCYLLDVRRGVPDTHQRLVYCWLPMMATVNKSQLSSLCRLDCKG